jgi:hypothetical protein
MGISRRALTTIPRRSFSGSQLAQFAWTLLACAGVVLLLPQPASSTQDGMLDVGTSVCRISPDAARTHQWTDDVTANDPDSCDDEDEDDDGDDDSFGGSGDALVGNHRWPTHIESASSVVHGTIAFRVFRPLDAHSLRGPPSVHQESPDAEFDGDDDDDDDSLGAHRAVILAAANSREPGLLSPPQFFHKAFTGSGRALRAPPQ